LWHGAERGDGPGDRLAVSRLRFEPDEEIPHMTRSSSWRRVTAALGTLAALGLLLYTIGAPFNHGG